MSQIPNLRLLLFSSSSPILSPLKPSLSFSLFPSKRHRFTINNSNKNNSPFKFTRRNNSNTNTNNDNNKGSSTTMEDPTKTQIQTSFGFNKRRAEGRDKSDKPKKELQLKVRKLNPCNTISYVQILGTGMDTQDTSPSVLLFFDRQRFIFNAGEGLQRFCTEHKIKLSKIDHIFLSRVCSTTAGGLPGLLLTLAGMGEEGMSVNVWGPSDLKYLVDAMKSFIPNAAMVHTRSFGAASNSGLTPASDLTKLTEPIVLVDDEVVKISAFIIRPIFMQDQTLIENGQAVKPGDISVIYVCELPEIKGKFHPEKAKELGLNPGPKYRELQLGNSVKSDKKDVMIHPSDVMDPSLPGPIVILVDCPTERHFQDLLSREAFNCFYTDASGNKQASVKSVTCVIHMSPVSVTSSPTYKNWMKRFGSSQHIMAGHTMKNVKIPILKASARIAARLNYLCPQFFPAPGFWTVEHLNHSASTENTSSEEVSSELCNCISAENLLKFTLRPRDHLGLDRSGIPSVTTPWEIIDELFSEIPEITETAQQVRKLWHGPAETEEGLTTMLDRGVVEEPWLKEDSSPSCLENIRRDDLEIVLLGTGSSQPSKYRNVSAVYINLFSKGSMLLDCGEGTLGQLKRRYGVEGADNAVKSLSCIWISHIHADHHTGLARVLALRCDLLRGVPHEPILVIGPRQLKRFLDAYQRLEDLDMLFLDCRNTTEASLEAFESASGSSNAAPGSPSKSSNARNEDLDSQISEKLDSTLFTRGTRMQSVWNRPASPVDSSIAFPILNRLKKLLNEAGLEALVSFPVVHCPQAFGVVLKATERINSVGKLIPGWKVVYSGDTRPCPEMVEASRCATVLIHEATFEDGMIEEAVAKNHSTTKEAIEVGSSAGAYRIILTHFSQRYPKIPVFDDSHTHNTCIAFDMMSVNIADLHALPKILPYVKILFRDDMMVDDSDDVVPASSTAV